MKRAYTVNHRLYIGLVLMFAVTLIISFVLPPSSKGSASVLAQILLNLSYGCIASTVVAWLIDCANTRSNNLKAHNLYDTVYLDLKLQIGFYLDLWSHFCAVSFEDVDYYHEKHTWVIWYNLTKENYCKAEASKQTELMQFYTRELSGSARRIVESIERILSQRYYLTMNNIMDSTLHSVLRDFRFEFTALENALSLNKNDEFFWTHLDAITKDLVNYINNWSDIQFYNTDSFAPFKFFDLFESRIREKTK